MTELPPSPFLQRCYMAFESDSQLFFVLDLVGGGDLFYHLVQKISEHGWGFPEDQARVLLPEVKRPRPSLLFMLPRSMCRFFLSLTFSSSLHAFGLCVASSFLRLQGSGRLGAHARARADSPRHQGKISDCFRRKQ